LHPTESAEEENPLKRLMIVTAMMCLLVSLVYAQELTTRMGNKEIIEMVGLGLSEDVIIEKIRTAPEVKFETDLEALKALKEAKVPDAIIKQMINPKAAPAVAAAPAAAVVNAAAKEVVDPNLPPKEVGVYWKNGAEFVYIEGQNVSQAQIGGRAASKFTMGIKSKHWNAYLNGPESKNRVKDQSPVFYFYVIEGTSANDFVLVKLDKKGDRRQFEVGSIGGWTGQKSGLREGNMKGFTSERVANRMYKVTITEPLKGGEYGFFMGTGQQMAMNDKEAGGSAQGRMYDFSIPQ
jgi:hypothetical protein